MCSICSYFNIVRNVPLSATEMRKVVFGSFLVGGILAAGNLGGMQSSEAKLSKSADPETGAHLCPRHLMSILHTREAKRRTITRDNRSFGFSSNKSRGTLGGNSIALFFLDLQ